MLRDINHRSALFFLFNGVVPVRALNDCTAFMVLATHIHTITSRSSGMTILFILPAYMYIKVGAGKRSTVDSLTAMCSQ